MTSEQIGKLKQQLNKEKEKIEHRLSYSENYGLDRSMKDSVGDLSNHDQHPADAGSEMFEREKDSALNELDEQHVKEIDRALARIEKGVYGICKACNKQISFNRLQALPYAEYCIEHAQ